MCLLEILTLIWHIFLEIFEEIEFEFCWVLDVIVKMAVGVENVEVVRRIVESLLDLKQQESPHG